MKNLFGHQILEELPETPIAKVYRCPKAEAPGTVIIQLLKVQNPSVAEVARFEGAYQQIRSLEMPGIVNPLAVEKQNGRFALILEDFPGKPLKELLQDGPMALPAFLTIAQQLAGTLGKLHQNDISHLAVSSHHILVHPETLETKLTDFRAAAELTRRYQALYDPRIVEEVLPYVSPEQTGRMNRTVDYRTDIYSSGVVLYEMLTGRLPFFSKDPLELIHAHIARKPEPPMALTKGIPAVLSNMVMKLLAKTSEERYQNAFGLSVDLQECRNRVTSAGTIAPFDIALRDISMRFNISQRLFGRETETDVLLSAFERVSRGGTELMLVSGHPGVGKSALVHEIHKPIVGRRGYFISGKFEQFRRMAPYNAIIQAFQNLLRQILSESRERVEAWRENLLAALAPNGTVLIDILPDLEMIIGPQPQTPELEPDETQRRLQMLFMNFTIAVTSSEHPLVMFLDDLQWADAASLQLVDVLITNSEIRHFFLIGAYRSNEVTQDHPLQGRLKKIMTTLPHVNIVTLEPLTAADVEALLVDFLRCDALTARPLAERIHAKTNGNPFFVNHFIRSLYEEKLLQHKGRHGWHWDLDAIGRLQVTDNVVELLAKKISRLPKNTLEVLKVCSCIGNRFDLETLAAVLGETADTVLSDLSKALSSGIVNARASNYIFQHDRIQEAAYSLIPDPQKKHLHLQIGQFAYARTDEKDLFDKVFYIVNQFNFARDLLSSEKERHDLARLNLIAGKKAVRTAAYEPALQYFEIGLELVREDGWRSDYGLSLDLHVETARAAYLSGDSAKMEHLVGIVLNTAESTLDKIRAYEIRIKAFFAKNEFKSALLTGLEVLDQLGVQIPAEPTDMDILNAIEETKTRVTGRPIEDLIHLPEAEDPLLSATMSMLTQLVTIAYFGHPRLYSVIACKMVAFSIDNGNTPFSVFGHIAYGLLNCGFLGDIETGYAFGKLTRALQKRLCAQGARDKTGFVFNVFIRHWKEPIQNTLAPLAEGYRIGLETGDYQYAGFCSHFYCIHCVRAGEPLQELDEKFEQSCRSLEKLKRKAPLGWSKIWRQAILNFMGRSEDPCRLQGEECDEEQMRPILLKEHEGAGLFDIDFLKLWLNIVFQNPAQAFDNAQSAKKYLSNVSGIFISPMFTFLDALACLGVMAGAAPEEKARLGQKVAGNLKRLEGWAQHAPMNHLNQIHLIKAEQSGLAGDDAAASDHYDRAVDLAAENGIIYDEALANELAGRYYLEKGKRKFARVYLQDARECYRRWGAGAKVADMDRTYTALLPAASQGVFDSGDATPPDRSTSLDFGTVMKASQAISGEIMLDRLLAKLMRISMENAGAQRGLMILEDQEQLLVEAEGEINREDVAVLKSIPLEAHERISPAIVNYVARTQKPLILQDAGRAGEFTEDPYVKRFQPKSILCFPIISQGKLSGIIYLENHLTTGAFTAERLEVLNVISTQAAISLQNARLFDSVKRAEARMKNLLETANEGFWEVDRKGFTVNVNPELCRILGFSRQDVIGRHILDFENHQNVEIVKQQSERLKRGEKSTYEVAIPRTDGSVVHCQINMSPILEGDDLVGSFAMISDITRIKEVEQEIRKLNADLEKRVKIRTMELNATLKKVEQANRDILASMRYAQLIQQSLLPNPREIQRRLPESFCIWQPKEIIGGDIYHFEFLDHGFVAAVMDCTGHGVPGAFMTMIAASSLRRIIREEACHDPAEILKRLNYIVKTTLHQDSGQALSDDGLDAAVCLVDKRSRTITYAGARLQLLYARNRALKAVKGDRHSIGYTTSDLDYQFTNHRLPIEKGMRVYLHTDGILDQMGGLNRRRFGRKRFTEILSEHMNRPLEHQRDALLKAFKDHKGINEQQDDVTVIGFALDGG